MTAQEVDDLHFLMDALQESQDTVRAYDTKAQIVGVGYIFAIGIVTNIGTKISNIPEMNMVTISLAWLVIVLPILLFGAVLYPTRKMAPSLHGSSSHINKVYYIDADQEIDVSTYLANVDKSDRRQEIAYELLKTAGLREIKRLRFLRALWVSAGSFAILFLSQLIRTNQALPL